MPDAQSFDTVFQELRAIFQQHEPGLAVKDDTQGSYYLETRHVLKNKQPLLFGGVQIKKNYVSYHLIPVYTHPDLLEGMSEHLRKRMQGKSCFNFTRLDPQSVQELSQLTARGFERYESEGLI
jgi:hypothetical protein